MGKIFLLGAGIYSSLQLTIETIQAIEVSDLVYILHDDPIVVEDIKRFNPKVIDCMQFYRKTADYPRHLIYKEIAEKIIEKVEKENIRVAFMLHGHPLFLVSASEMIIEEAFKKQIQVDVLPGISSFDTLLSDLKIDFGYAVQMYDVNFYYENDIIINTNVPLILFQITTFQNYNVIRVEPNIKILTPLIKKLSNFYRPINNIFIIHSASHILEKKTIIRSTFADILNRQDIELWTRPTIYIPEI